MSIFTRTSWSRRSRVGLSWPFVRSAAIASLLLGGASATDYFATTQAGFDYLNTIDFAPGDRILLAGDTTFTGTLTLGSSDTGTDAQGNLIAPIVVTSFGTGVATISAGDGAAITAYNNGGIEISRLKLVGSGVAADGTTTSTKSGISIYNDLPGNVKHRHIRLDDIEVSGFGLRGVSIGGYNGSSGFDDVRVTRLHVHDNLHAGIETYGYPGVTNALTNVVVAECLAHHHPGDPDASGNTGSGIVLGGVTGGVVEHCEAHDNGANNTASEGPVGIWAYQSDSIVLQHNESHHNTTQGGDGGGFDFDIQMTNSVMQYNYSHDNDGAGFLIYGTAGANASTGHTVRYNVSQNDGRDSGSGAASGINVSNNVRDIAVYGNTVLMSAPAGSTVVPAIKVTASDTQPDEITVANNIFVTTGGTRLVNLSTTGDVTFAGNNYWSSGDAFVIRDGQNFSSLSSWRSSKGRERLAGQATGFSVDPLFEATPFASRALESGVATGLIAFKLRPESPLIDRGLDLASAFGIDPGPRDFFAAAVKQGPGFEIGAHEFALDAPRILGFTYHPEASTVTIRYQSEVGTRFGVRRSADAAGDPATTWTALPATATGDGTVMEYIDTPPPGAAQFYVLVRE